jgi:hypothetical protein
MLAGQLAHHIGYGEELLIEEEKRASVSAVEEVPQLENLP